MGSDLEVKVGVIARDDHGGLAAQTYEAWRNLRADRVLVIDMGVYARGDRGGHARYRADWTETHVALFRHFGIEVDQFFAGLDVVYTAETIYDERLWTIAKNAGVKVVLHTNPELFATDHHNADALWVPTDWETARMPDRVQVMPMPCVVPATYRPVSRLDTMFFTAGAAMMDRNGAESVRGSLPMVDHPCRLLVRLGANHDPMPNETVGKVDVEYLPAVESYDQVIPEGTDLLLMPRRYGGLCLPVQEAAARGIPAIMSDLSPQNRWPSGTFLTRATLRTRTQMKGGLFEIQDVSPGDLADMINHVAGHPDLLQFASARARAWAESLSWENQLPIWQTELAKVVAA